MNEITADELYYGLLAHGLFSEKLPPIFTSEPFFHYCVKLGHNFHDKSYHYVYYENMKNTNIPRSFGIPNPMAYQRQCACLRDYWSELQAHFSKMTCIQKYRISRIHIRKMYDHPALFQMNYRNWKVDGAPEIDILFGRRYMVKADISLCFPSIYTHALPWALVTKPYAKQHIGDYNAWFNKIDSYTSNTTHGETHGLLIGPHASNLLSEIILSTIDNELCQRNWSYIRAIDDYTCYVDTYEDGQRFLVELAAALRKYDLSLNYRKTEILKLPLAITTQWTRKLKSHSLHSLLDKSEPVNYHLVQSYLDYTIELFHENQENSAIINYAAIVLSKKTLSFSAKEYYAKTLMNLSMIYPYLVTIMDNVVFSKFCATCTTHDCIKIYANIIFSRGFETRNFEEAAYALFFAIKYNLHIDTYSPPQVIDSNDCVLLTLSYLYAKHHNMTNAIKLLKKYAESLTIDPDTYDQYWLFIYEALPQTKLTGDWKALKRSSISFVKPTDKW